MDEIGTEPTEDGVAFIGPGVGTAFGDQSVLTGWLNPTPLPLNGAGAGPSEAEAGAIGAGVTPIGAGLAGFVPLPGKAELLKSGRTG
ncbi:MAG: hypothetical protein WC565_02215 [Parcubacteria group bacterium]